MPSGPTNSGRDNNSAPIETLWRHAVGHDCLKATIQSKLTTC